MDSPKLHSHKSDTKIRFLVWLQASTAIQIAELRRRATSESPVRTYSRLGLAHAPRSHTAIQTPATAEEIVRRCSAPRNRSRCSRNSAQPPVRLTVAGATP